MIAKLTGMVDSLGDDWAIIDVGGVGYLVHASARTLGRLALGGRASLMVDTHMREDQITLYAFFDQTERTWFRQLITVQGVGPRLALSVLSALAPDALALAVAAEDRKALVRADGVGPRLAQRIVAELKDKVRAPLGGAARAAVTATADMAGNGASPAGDGADPAIEDAVSALVNLGYGRSEVFVAVARARDALGPDGSFDALVRQGLKELSA